MSARERFTFYISRLARLLLEPGREWKVIRDEPPGGVTLFRDFIVSPCAYLSAIAALLRWTTDSLHVAIRWGIINFIACTVGGYLAFRVARKFLATDVARAGHVALQLITYTATVYLFFRSLSMGFPSRSVLGELLAVLGLYSFYTLYTGLRVITSLPAARVQNICLITGMVTVILPFVLTRLLAIAFRVPIII
ncbi:MAG: YIP1 family protein [Odoribacteraceae bacterium]|jgi:hypothetical protein|nr:YIP1 family protein [Odoribacteraceae bacterium]